MPNKFLFQKPELELEGEAAQSRPNVPDKAAVRCAKCKGLTPSAVFNANYKICPKCGFYHKMTARERIELLSADSFTELFTQNDYKNVLDFPGYDEKIAAAKEQSGEAEAVVTGEAVRGGVRFCVFALDYRFMMGSMGSVVGEKITALFEYARQNSLPVVGFTVSGGARMQEGIISLMQMAKTSGAVKRHGDEGLLYLSVLCDPTTGGVSASFAFLGDIILAEPKALIGFAGPRVIEQTIKECVPVGSQSSERLQKKGFIDLIVPRHQLKEKIYELLELHGAGKGGEDGRL